jgi:hypothetical protein
VLFPAAQGREVVELAQGRIVGAQAGHAHLVGDKKVEELEPVRTEHELARGVGA